MIDASTDFYKHVDNFAKYAHVGWRRVFGNEDLLSKVFVTISIPTYNRPDTLKDAVDSALNQEDYDDYCVMVVDNDPADGTATEGLIKSYHSDKLLYYKNDENIGMFGNQNRCFEIPKSEYVVMLHDDDLILPCYLKECCTLLKNNDIDGLQPDKVKWFEAKQQRDEIIIPSSKYNKLKRWVDLDNYWSFRTGSQTGGLYKRKVILSVGGYNSDYYPSADFCMGIQLMEKYKIYSYTKILTIYRVGKNATLKQETLAGFMNDCYYAFDSILKKMSICKLFRLLILSYKSHTQYEGLKEMYNSNFIFDFNNLGTTFSCPKWLVVPIRLYVSLKLTILKAIRYGYFSFNL